ncbi:hypothetical protein Pcinc_005622 [Petrolisthes cinctipes]|uniref:sphinganine-1-phosphate aldolase n=1 Tax=Petrolisthes cinctipes TaxID=88211 RepID=A0AAE1KZZ1_PETCI|nr:hypothetical protein Pcinc_018399 [Petrolisthes cinctipes]KAK3890438.1 hypothetical protein Pcinc_005622 [Petrolisthes cinctipes]
MEALRQLLLHAENKFEAHTEGMEGWQLVAGTAAITLTTITLKDLYLRRLDVYTDVRDWLFRSIRKIPAVKNYISEQLDQSRRDIENEMFEKSGIKDVRPPLHVLPPTGWSTEDLLSEANHLLTQGRYNWQEGKISGGTFTGLETDFNHLIEKIYGVYAFQNPLHADVFPGVRKMEAEIVRMTINIFHGEEEACGTMTSGGSESILLAVKAMRDYGRAMKGITRGEIVACYTVHAAYDKAAHILGLKLRKVRMDQKTCKSDIKAMEQAITSNTIMLVASAPTFPHGIIDDVEAVGALGLQYNIPVNVDSCMGGFLLPFMERAGFPIQPFDFRVPGVVVISADTHKYGNAPKGSSVLMYSSPEFRHYQYFVTPDWPGGIYATPSVPGSRPGALVAVCWAALLYQGFDGYIAKTKKIITTARRIKEQLRSLSRIEVMGDPLTSIVAFKGNGVDILKVGDILNEHGWHLTFTQYPPGLHICLTTLQATDSFPDMFVSAVKEAVKEVASHPQETTGLGKVYGTAAGIPDKNLVGEAAKVFLHCYYKTEPTREHDERGEEEIVSVGAS